jgi:hypothetical protein
VVLDVLAFAHVPVKYVYGVEWGFTEWRNDCKLRDRKDMSAERKLVTLYVEN